MLKRHLEMVREAGNGLWRSCGTLMIGKSMNMEYFLSTLESVTLESLMLNENYSPPVWSLSVTPNKTFFYL